MKKNQTRIEPNEIKIEGDNSYNKINLVLNILETVYKSKKMELDKKDFELNSLSYNEAFKLDHRNLCEFYISLLKNNHPFLFLLVIIMIIIQK